MIRAVMTCNREIWDAYGERAVESWVRYWPSDAWLELYAEDFRPVVADGRVRVHALPAWHTAWKQRHAVEVHPDAHGRGTAPGQRERNGGAYNYRRDAVKFSHKIAALTHASMNGARAGVIIMMDADVITHSPVTSEWLDRVFPENYTYCAWLDRQGWDYPECGFVMFRANHSQHRPFMAALQYCYERDVLFNLPQTHDSFVLKQLVDHWVRYGKLTQPYSLSGPTGRKSSHPLPVSMLGERLDHLKGKRKEVGRTMPTEAQRSGGYWS